MSRSTATALCTAVGFEHWHLGMLIIFVVRAGIGDKFGLIDGFGHIQVY